VTDNVVGLLERAEERQYDAALEQLGNTLDAFVERAQQRITLAEMGVGCVEDQSLPTTEVVVE
jgi:N12 class adenine-specific DNA methylase